MQTLKFVKKEAPYWTAGTHQTPNGTVFRVSSAWTRRDTWGMVRSRTSAFRMHYAVEPGLYAVGNPDGASDVFATANYKLSFDIVRRALAGMDAWLLVLDTKNINVWCAAGKGTFGTEELVRRIAAAGLEKIVRHRFVIVPQLGAVGVSASTVRKRTGFQVRFGPVDARDIPAYVQAGYRKTEAMRLVRFPLPDRMALTPMEINPAMKKYPWFAGAVLLIFGLQPEGVLFASAWRGGLPFLLLGLLAVFTGAFATPVLLPFVPFRSFALKGLVMGLAAMAAAAPFLGPALHGSGFLLAAAWILFPAISSYIALQFTGSTTFTGMTGVRKELRIGIPVYIGSSALSVLLVILFKARAWGLI